MPDPTVCCPCCLKKLKKSEVYDHLDRSCSGVDRSSRPAPDNSDTDDGEDGGDDFFLDDEESGSQAGDDGMTTCMRCSQQVLADDLDAHMLTCGAAAVSSSTAGTASSGDLATDITAAPICPGQTHALTLGVRGALAGCDACGKMIQGTDPHYFDDKEDCDFCSSCSTVRCSNGHPLKSSDLAQFPPNCIACDKCGTIQARGITTLICDCKLPDDVAALCQTCHGKKVQEMTALGASANPATAATCKKNHPLTRAPASYMFQCDICNGVFKPGTMAFSCEPCEYDTCLDCTTKAGASALKVNANKPPPVSTATSTPATTKPPTAAAAATTTSSSLSSSAAAAAPDRCAKGHPLVKEKVDCMWMCDGCGGRNGKDTFSYRCDKCDEDHCQACHDKNAQQSTSAPAATTTTTPTPTPTPSVAPAPAPAPKPTPKPATPAPVTKPAAAATTTTASSGMSNTSKPSVSFMGGADSGLGHAEGRPSGLGGGGGGGLFTHGLSMVVSQAFDPADSNLEYDEVASSIESRRAMRTKDAQRQFCTDMIPDREKEKRAVEYVQGIWGGKPWVGHFIDNHCGNTQLEGGPPLASCDALATVYERMSKLPAAEQAVWFPKEVFGDVPMSKLMATFSFTADTLRQPLNMMEGCKRPLCAPEAHSIVKKATYGGKDVRDKLLALFKDGVLNIKGGYYNRTFGDPKPGEYKYLEIEFSDNYVQFKNVKKGEREECEVNLVPEKDRGKACFDPDGPEYLEQALRFQAEHLAAKIAALKKDEVMFRIAGWQNGKKKSHAVTMLFHANSDSEIDVVLCNTGAGVGAHTGVRAYPRGRALCATQLGCLPKADIGVAFFYAFLRANSVDDSMHGAGYFYNHLLPTFFSHAKPGKWCPPELTTPRTPQKAGTCYHKCITKSVKLMLSHRGLSYRQIKAANFAARVMMVQQAFEELRTATDANAKKMGPDAPLLGISVSDEKLIRIGCHMVLRKAEKGRSQSKEPWVYDPMVDITTKLTEQLVSLIPSVLVDAPRVRQPVIGAVPEGEAVSEEDAAHPFMDLLLDDCKHYDAELLSGEPAVDFKLSPLEAVRSFATVAEGISYFKKLKSTFSNESLAEATVMSRMMRYNGFCQYQYLVCDVMGLPAHDVSGFWRGAVARSKPQERLELVEELKELATNFIKLWSGLPDAPLLCSARFIIHCMLLAAADAIVRIDGTAFSKVMKNFATYNPLNSAALMSHEMHSLSLVACYDAIHRHLTPHSSDTPVVFESYFTKASMESREDMNYSIMDDKGPEVKFWLQMRDRCEAKLKKGTHLAQCQPVQKIMAFMHPGDYYWEFAHPETGKPEQKAMVAFMRLVYMCRVATFDFRKSIKPCDGETDITYVQFGGTDGGVHYLKHELNKIHKFQAPDAALAGFRRTLFAPKAEKEILLRPGKPLVAGLPPEFDVTMKQLFGSPYVGVTLVLDELARRGSWKMSAPLAPFLDAFLFEPRQWASHAPVPKEAPLEGLSVVPTTHTCYALEHTPGAFFVPLAKLVKLALEEDDANPLDKSFFHIARIAAFSLGLYRDITAKSSNNAAPDGLADLEQLVFSKSGASSSIFSRFAAFLKRRQTTADDPNLRAIVLCHRALLAQADRSASVFDRGQCVIAAVTALNSFCNDEKVVEMLGHDICSLHTRICAEFGDALKKDAGKCKAALDAAVTDLMGAACSERWSNTEGSQFVSENWLVHVHHGLITSKNQQAPAYLPPVVAQSDECRAVFGDSVIRCQVSDLRVHCKKYRVLLENSKDDIEVTHWSCVPLSVRVWRALGVLPRAGGKNVYTVGATTYVPMPAMTFKSKDHCDREEPVTFTKESMPEALFVHYWGTGDKETSANAKYGSLAPAFAAAWKELVKADESFKAIKLDKLTVFQPADKTSSGNARLDATERLLFACNLEGELESPAAFADREKNPIALSELVISYVGATPVLMWFSLTSYSGRLTRHLTWISHHDLAQYTTRMPTLEYDAVASSFQAEKPFSTTGRLELDHLSYSSVQVAVKHHGGGGEQLEVVSPLAMRGTVPEALIEERTAWFSYTTRQISFLGAQQVPDAASLARGHLFLRHVSGKSTTTGADSFFGTIAHVGSNGSPPASPTSSPTTGTRILASPYVSRAKSKSYSNLVTCLGRLNGMSQVLPWMQQPAPGAACPLSSIEIELPRLRLRFTRVLSMDADGNEVVRFGPVQHPGWYLSDFCTPELLQLLHGFPHGVLLQTDAQMLSLLVPSAAMVRPKIETSPLSTKTLAEHATVMGASNRVYRIPIHSATMHFFPESLEIALYLIHCKLLARDYQDAALLAESATCEATLARREKRVLGMLVGGLLGIEANQDGGAGNIFSASSDDLDSHPNALAVMLRVFIAVGGSNFGVGPCSLLPVGQIYGRYMSVINHVSANLRLSLEDEAAYFASLFERSPKDLKMYEQWLEQRRSGKLMPVHEEKMTITSPAGLGLFNTVKDYATPEKFAAEMHRGFPKSVKWDKEGQKHPCVEHLIKDTVEGNTHNMGIFKVFELLGGAAKFTDAAGKAYPEKERVPLLRYVLSHRLCAMNHAQRGANDEEAKLLGAALTLAMYGSSADLKQVCAFPSAMMKYMKERAHGAELNTYWSGGTWNESPIKGYLQGMASVLSATQNKMKNRPANAFGAKAADFKFVSWTVARLRATSKRPSDLAESSVIVEPVKFGKKGARESSVGGDMNEDENEEGVNTGVAEHIRVNFAKSHVDMMTGRPLQHVVQLLERNSKDQISKLGAAPAGDSTVPARMNEPSLGEQQNRPGGSSFFHRMQDAINITKEDKPKAPPHILERLLLATTDKKTVVGALRQLWKFLFKRLLSDEREAKMAQVWAVEHVAYVARGGRHGSDRTRDILAMFNNVDPLNCPPFLSVARLLTSTRFHDDLSSGNPFLASDKSTTRDIAKVAVASMLRASRATQIRHCLSSITTALRMITEGTSHERDWIAMIQALVGTLLATRLYTVRENSGDSPSLNPKLLLFEYLFDIILWGRQLDLIQELTDLAAKDVSSIKGMLMGLGKSSTVAPLLSLNLTDFLARERPDGVVILTVPPALVAQTIDVVGRRFCIMSGSPVLRLRCTRYGSAESTFRKLAIAKKCRGLVICEPDDIKGVQLRLAEQCLEHGAKQGLGILAARKDDAAMNDAGGDAPADMITEVPEKVAKGTKHDDAGSVVWYCHLSNNCGYLAWDIWLQNEGKNVEELTVAIAKDDKHTMDVLYKGQFTRYAIEQYPVFALKMLPKQVIQLATFKLPAGQGGGQPSARIGRAEPAKEMPEGDGCWGYESEEAMVNCQQFQNGCNVADCWVRNNNTKAVDLSFAFRRNEKHKFQIEPVNGAAFVDDDNITFTVQPNSSACFARCWCVDSPLPRYGYRAPFYYKAKPVEEEKDEDKGSDDDADSDNDNAASAAAESNGSHDKPLVASAAQVGDIDFDMAAYFDKAVDADAPSAGGDEDDALTTAMKPAVLKSLTDGILIIDEADFVLNPTRSELNFPVGEKHLIELGAPRWLFCMAFLRRALVGLDEKYQDLAVNRTPHLHVVSKDWFNKSFLPWLAGAAAQALAEVRETAPGTAEGQAKLSSSQVSSLEAFLKDPAAEAPPSLPGSSATSASMCVLAKLWVHRLADHILGKIHNVAYGFPSEERQKLDPDRVVAVPYAAQAVPSATSEFAHPDIAAGFTYLTFRHHGMRPLDIRSVVVSLREQLNIERGPIHTRRTSLLWLQLLAGGGGGSNKKKPIALSDIDPFDETQLASIASSFGTSHTLVEYYLNNIVFPKILKFSALKLHSSAQDLANRILFPRATVGFTGTTDDVAPKSVEITHATQDVAKILATLSDEKIVNVSVLDKDHAAPEAIVRWIAGSGKFDALIDSGGLITGLENEQVAELALQHLPAHKQAVVFLDPGNSQVFLSRSLVEEGSGAQPVCECNFPLAQRFAFFDQVHCTGTDVAQSSVSHAALLIGKDDTLRDVAQAVWRMRKLGRSTQHATFFVPRGVLALIYDLPVLKKHCNGANKGGGGGSLEHVDRDMLLTWLALKSLDQSEANTVRRNEQEGEAPDRRSATKQLLTAPADMTSSNYDPVRHLTAKLDHSIPEKWTVTKSGGDVDSTQEQQKQQQQQQQMQMSKYVDSMLKVYEDKKWALSSLGKGLHGNTTDFCPLADFMVTPVWDSKKAHQKKLGCVSGIYMTNNFLRVGEKLDVEPPYFSTPLAVLHFTTSPADPGDVALVNLREAEAIYLACTEKVSGVSNIALWSTQGLLIAHSAGVAKPSAPPPALLLLRLFRCETSFSREEIEVLKRHLKVTSAGRRGELGDILNALFPKRRLPSVRLRDTSFNHQLVEEVDHTQDKK